MVKVKIKGTNQPVDPLNFRYHDGEIVFLPTYCYTWTQRLMMPPFTVVTTPAPGRHQARHHSSEEWDNVSFAEHCYITYEGFQISEQEIASKEFINLAEDWEVDFPSLLLVYTPDDKKPLYDRTKVIANYLAGIQSQNSVKSKFEEQQNKDQ